MNNDKDIVYEFIIVIYKIELLTLEQANEAVWRFMQYKA